MYNIEKDLEAIVRNQVEMMASRERRNREEKKRGYKSKTEGKRREKFNKNLLRTALFDSELAENL